MTGKDKIKAKVERIDVSEADALTDAQQRYEHAYDSLKKLEGALNQQQVHEDVEAYTRDSVKAESDLKNALKHGNEHIEKCDITLDGSVFHVETHSYSKCSDKEVFLTDETGHKKLHVNGAIVTVSEDGHKDVTIRNAAFADTIYSAAHEALKGYLDSDEAAVLKSAQQQVILKAIDHPSPDVPSQTIQSFKNAEAVAAKNIC